jgi:shikimate dehydrogenase
MIPDAPSDAVPADKQAGQVDTGHDLLLGLIGDNIGRSRSPALHVAAGRQAGLNVRYDRLVPALLGQDFETVFASVKAAGYRGVNITYPYKERVTSLVRLADPVLRAIGAVNTVTFEADGPLGHNTDYTGFKSAYRAAFGATPPGTVLLVGAGGVGRAIAFGLADLGAEALILRDTDAAKAEMLAVDLRGAFPALDVTTRCDAGQPLDGVVNGTPVGMDGKPGNPIPDWALRAADWAFDAVYTPKDTEFLTAAAARGLKILSGWELFFHQGLDAWTIFSGRLADAARLRAELTGTGEVA